MGLTAADDDPAPLVPWRTRPMCRRPASYPGAMNETSAPDQHEPAADASAPVERIRTRACLEALPAYVAGKPPADDGRRRYKVSSNESPYAPIPAVLDAATAALTAANRYPDMGVRALREALAARHDVTPEQICVSTGSTAVIADLVRAVVDPGDEVVYPWRSFEAYPIIVGAQGGTSIRVPLTASHVHDLPAMAAAITERTRLVLLCTPNNPTGTSLSYEALASFLRKVPQDVVVAIDEAYREFHEPATVADTTALFRDHANVILLRTFSKLQGLAGLRIGYGIAHPRLARALTAVTILFGASAPAQAAALASLQPDVCEELDRRAAALRAERDRVQDALAADGWDLPRSQGNFVFFPVGERTGRFAAFCDEHGLVVRPYGTDGVRVTIAEPEANDLLLEICRQRRS